ncbi:MAG: hypothetical protein LBC74_04485 [Planctomycetaceae bacterium]|nr:hypothetical protein [Planctomycetaceae bacterium]
MLLCGCLQQPYHSPVDPFALDPVLLHDNRSNYLPVQNIANNRPSNTAPIPQPNTVSNTQYQYQFTDNAVNLPPPMQAREIRQVTHVNDIAQNDYRYNNSFGNYSGSLSYNSSAYPNNLSSDSSMLLRSQAHQVPQVRQSQETIQASLQYPQDSVNSGIRIDPSLNELGARVVAEDINRLAEFRGGWRHSGSYGFLPQAEYLVDGGDGDGSSSNYKVLVKDDWSVMNLDVGDTVAHYDTVDGRTVVEGSNRVHIYAPRFGAVRKVEGVVKTDHSMSLGEMNQHLRTGTGKTSERTDQTAQEFVAGYTRGRDDLHGIRSRMVGAGVGSNEGLAGYNNFEGVVSYSDTLRLMKLGSAEIVHLAEGCQNARVWQGSEGVKIKASYKVPMSMSVGEGVGQLFKIDDSGIAGKSQLRLIKVASRGSASSGDVIEFTLRFDNLGTEPLGNITIMDNLTTRLEFIPDSAMSSVPSGFVLEPNGVSSFTLRFEIKDPLEAGKFGVVQFRCRVL